MNAIPSTNAERAGKWFGRARRSFGRNEARAIGWLARRGVPAKAGRLLFWVATLVALGMLLYIVFWLVLLLLFAVVVALAVHNRDHDEPEEWAIGDQGEHKKSVFYDPINYNDDPDPRFDGEE